MNSLDHTKYKEIPIKTNNTVHTGPKTQLGGLKRGLFKLLYQVLICGVVKTAPTVPTNSQIIMLIKSFTKLLKLIKVIICNLADTLAEFPDRCNLNYYLCRNLDLFFGICRLRICLNKRLDCLRRFLLELGLRQPVSEFAEY